MTLGGCPSCGASAGALALASPFSEDQRLAVGHANEGFELPGLGEFFRPLSSDTTVLRARRLGMGTLTTRRHRGNCVAP